MVRMIDYECFCRIKKAQSEGLKASQIAQQLALDERTVRKWMATSHFQLPKRASRKSKLDAYKAQIRRLLEHHPYTTTQIFQKLRAAGYTGGISILKDYVRIVRPAPKPAYLSLSFAPGECAQVDWGQYGTIQVGHTRRRLSFFVMTLCHSRMMYVEFTLTEKMEQWLACHLHAFTFFGGVPAKVMIDNLRCAVLDHPLGGPTRFHPRYLELAAHFGFSPVACAPRKPHEKGRVERCVGYVKKNLLAGLEIPEWAALEAEARRWLDEVANVRLHRETRRKPAEMFAAEEQPALQPLGISAFDSSVTSTVRATRQFRVHYDANRYSVPSSYAGYLLTIKAYADKLLFYHQGQLIAQHPRNYDRGQDVKEPDHESPLLLQRRRARDQHIYRRFIALTSQAEPFYQQMQQRRLNPMVHVRKIVALIDIYGVEALAQALQDAATFGAYSSEYILNILQQRTRTLPEPGPLHLPHKQDLLDLELPEPDCSIYESLPNECDLNPTEQDQGDTT